MDKSPDLYDWEVLQNSSDASDLGEFDQQLDSNCDDPVFQSDYFSFDSHRKPPSSEDGSAVSDNPSWIEPASSDVPFPITKSADLWSDSGSDRSVSRQMNELDDKLESQASFEKKYWSESGKVFNLDYRNDEEFEAQVVESLETKVGFDSGIEIIQQHENDAEIDSTDASGDDVDDDGGLNSNRNLAIEEAKSEEKNDESARVIWWKVPVDLFKYCVFRVSPVWSFSVAAALVGFVILGRRLYKMKRKTHGLQLKVILDDKMVSQFRSHAARLNEAFSLVRRVPIVRPSLPAPPGAAPWPVMSMR